MRFERNQKPRVTLSALETDKGPVLDAYFCGYTPDGFPWVSIAEPTMEDLRASLTDLGRRLKEKRK